MVSLADGKLDSELFQAQAHIWNHTFNFINSMALKCAIELGIPDAIHSHGKPIPLSQLIAKLPIHPSKTHCISRIMRILIHSGFFAKEKDEQGYVLTNVSNLLLKDNPFSIAPFSIAMLDPALTNSFHHLSTWFQNEDPTAFHTTHGRSLWDYACEEPNYNNIFNEGFASDSRLVMSVLMDKYQGVFEGLNSLVDVGGGTGSTARAIAKAFPELDVTVFDLPHVVAGLQGSQNLNYVAGDMFELIPPADALLLKLILHDWTDKECLTILERCKEAIKGKKGGKLIIIDMVLEHQNVVDHESIKTQLLYDMLMMPLVNGKERNEKEWRKIFHDAGFTDYKITPILGLRSIIEVYPN